MIAGLALGMLSASAANAQLGLTYRIAISHDGNLHDKDDWGASAFDFAILAAFKRQDALVHFDYNDHVGLTNGGWEAEMVTSSTGGPKNFGGDPKVLFDDMKNVAGAVANFKAEGDKSTATDRLLFIVAGPMEVPWRCLNAMDPAKRQFVTFVSHSGWNDNHTDGPQLTHTWSSLQSLPGGAKFIHISDQNAKLGTSANWGGLKTIGGPMDAAFQWLFTRQQGKPGDVSDAGMTWYAMTGAQNGGPSDFITKFKDITPWTPGTTNLVSRNFEGSLKVAGTGNSLQVNLPFAGIFQGITVSDLSGHRITSAIPQGRTGWIDIPGIALANGEYFVSVNGPNGVSHAAGKVNILK